MSELVKPKVTEASPKAFDLLIDGYINTITQRKDAEIDLNIICMIKDYYQQNLFALILDKEKLTLSLCDTTKDNTILTSNSIIKLNNSETEKEKKKDYRIRDACFCYKRDIKIDNFLKRISDKFEIKNDYNYNNNKYDALFVFCGEFRSHHLLLYPQSILSNLTDINSFNIYHYKLSELPFHDETARSNSPVYSDKYGLIMLSKKPDHGKIAYLNINTHDKLSWKIKELPKEIGLEYCLQPPTYCLIDNDKQLFIADGLLYQKDCQQASIYNLENGKFEILPEYEGASGNNPGIVYDKIKNRMYFGGGSSHSQSVRYYDFDENEFGYLGKCMERFYGENVTLWLNKRILRISHTDSLGAKINYEWIDLDNMENGWIDDSKNINIVIKKIWEKKERKDHLLIVGFQ